VFHEHVQYVSSEVHIECFKAKDFNISVLIQGQETKFRNFNGNNWCDKRNSTRNVCLDDVYNGKDMCCRYSAVGLFRKIKLNKYFSH